MSTSLLLSTAAVSCYTALMVNLIWFADEKKSIMSELSNMGGLKLSFSQARSSTISQSLCAGALSCWKLQSAAKIKLFQQLRKSDCFERLLWLQW